MPVPGTRRAAVLAGLAAAAIAAASAAVPAGAATGPRWAPSASATVHPGIAVTIAGVPCRVGAVLTDGTDAYLAVPASCTGTSAGAPTDGCRESQVPLGLHVTVPGARYPAILVYSSFLEMALHSDTNPVRCADNSLSLLRLDRRDIARTTPTIPSYGGPTAVAPSASSTGGSVDVLLAAPTSATATSAYDGGWSQGLLAAASVTAADRGAPALDASGRLLGMVTLIPQTRAGQTYVSSFAPELSYLKATYLPHARLALGTVAFGG